MKTIAIAHSKGGVGKSLLTLNIAGAYTKNEDPIIIIDLDAQHSSTMISNARAIPFKVFQTQDEAGLFAILDEYEDTHTILIDCIGADTDLNRLALINSDIVISPVKDNSFEVLAFKKFIALLDDLRDKKDIKAFGVINNVHPRASDFDRLRDLVSDSKVTLLDSIIRQRADYNNTLEAGTTVAEASNFSKAAKEIQTLVTEIKGL